MSSDQVSRKLTTILAADVVGYSKMMAADEEATLRTLRSYRAIIDELIGKHGGRLFNTAGDAVMVEFDSAVESVRCAVSIQEELQARNAELPDDRKMRFRIGINVGDVMIEGGDLFGDGVNVASRLEGIARPGAVYISASTFEQVKNKLSIGFEDLGPQQVKNIPHPVGAFQVISGPISVSPAEKGDAGAKVGAARRWVPAAVAVVVLAVAGGGYMFWKGLPRGPAPVPSFPANFTTDSMKSDEIQKLMGGFTIQGVSKKGKPFTIRLMADNTTEVEVRRTGDAAGAAFRETGKWWAEPNRFCMQFSRFAKGRRMCPRIVREGEALYATRGRDGTRLNWTLSKQ